MTEDGQSNTPELKAASGTKLRIFVRILTPIFILALALGAGLDYRRSTVLAEKRFNDRQAFMSYQAAERLGAVFREVDKLLTLLEHLAPGKQAGTRGELALATVINHLREHGAMGGMMLTTEGDLAQTAGVSRDRALGLVHKLERCRGVNVLEVQGPLKSTLSPSGWLLVATMLQGKARDEQWCVALLLDWNTLRESIRKMARYGKDSYSWVLDHKGRLIMHPDHREQLGKQILSPGKECGTCHTSFDLQREMAAGATGTRRVQVRGHKPKLVAFTPVKVGAARWSLAVATPADHVTRDTRRDLWATVLFTGLIMLVMVSGALVLDRVATRRILQADRFNKVLEQEVEKRTAELASLYRRLNAIQSHHTRLERVAVAGEMAAIVAHEIRTPLNVLSMNAQMINHLLGNVKIPNQEQVQQVLDTLESEIHRINQLVQDNLLSHARGSPAELKPMNINEVLEESVRFMEPEAQRNQVSLKLEATPELPMIRADESKLRQVLLNIILNGIQASPHGGEVAVHAERDHEWVRIWIRDNGPGLSEDKLEQVFKPFMTTKKDGTGLGLAICARLVKEMEGEIDFCADAGQGACFQVVLPMAAGEEEPICPS